METKVHDSVGILEKDEILETNKENKMISNKIDRVLKRIIDILGGTVGLVLLLPLTIIVKIANILAKDNGPLFYSHDRIGKDGKLFKLYKFRSMVVGADEKLKTYLEENEEAREEYKKYKKLKNDPRITKVGNFIRKTSIDEFPQFIRGSYRKNEFSGSETIFT